jgi:hypothetical protein
MTKKTFSSSDVDIPHADMVRLRKAGQLNLGISDSLSIQISTSTIKPTKTTASAAFAFWGWVAIGLFLFSIYWSFVSSWWWFIVGFAAMIIVWKANKKGNSENLLDAAMIDEEFYDRVRNLGGWMYQVEEDEVAKFRPKV